MCEIELAVFAVYSNGYSGQPRLSSSSGLSARYTPGGGP